MQVITDMLISAKLLQSSKQFALSPLLDAHNVVIYIYIEGEREREREIKKADCSLSMFNLLFLFRYAKTNLAQRLPIQKCLNFFWY